MTPSAKPARPARPYPDFPLFPHASGRWAKKVRGKMHYFGPWRDPQAALDKWLQQKDYLLAGRTPRTPADGIAVKDLCNRFRAAKLHQQECGEITRRTLGDYVQTCDRVVEMFGRDRVVSDLASEDFEALRAHFAKTRGPVSLGNQIKRVRVLFKYGYDAGLYEHPMRYGPTFKLPSKKVLRLHRIEAGPRMFEAAELRRILDAAEGQMQAMVLLAINAGLDNSDVGKLRFANLNLDSGWLHYPRPKTGVQRRCPLWPETVAALREAIANRPVPKNPDHAALVFLTKDGRSWNKDKASSENAISCDFRKRLDKLGIQRKGVGFYAIRHTFRTVADSCRDFPAIDLIMGHTDDSMGDRYRERIDDTRLAAVVLHVSGWLFPEI
jgi:integrase